MPFDKLCAFLYPMNKIRSVLLSYEQNKECDCRLILLSRGALFTV